MLFSTVPFKLLQVNLPECGSHIQYAMLCNTFLCKKSFWNRTFSHINVDLTALSPNTKGLAYITSTVCSLICSVPSSAYEEVAARIQHVHSTLHPKFCFSNDQHIWLIFCSPSMFSCTNASWTVCSQMRRLKRTYTRMQTWYMPMPLHSDSFTLMHKQDLSVSLFGT